MCCWAIHGVPRSVATLCLRIEGFFWGSFTNESLWKFCLCLPPFTCVSCFSISFEIRFAYWWEPLFKFRYLSSMSQILIPLSNACQLAAQPVIPQSEYGWDYSLWLWRRGNLYFSFLWKGVEVVQARTVGSIIIMRILISCSSWGICLFV